jgi:CRISPR type II-A-associated protein Csn2
MKLINPNIEYEFNLDEPSHYILIIENKRFLYNLTSDLSKQCYLEEDGETSLINSNKKLSFSLNIELISDLSFFSLNSKKIYNSMIKKIVEESKDSEYFKEIRTINSISTVLIGKLVDTLDIQVDYSNKFEMADLLKIYNLKIVDNCISLIEKLITYINNVSELKKITLFIIYFPFSYLNNNEIEKLMIHCKYKGISTLFIESIQRMKLLHEKIIIIDDEFCEIVL